MSNNDDFVLDSYTHGVFWLVNQLSLLWGA